jgi:uncharacterized membrane protein YphA (DoxX/SURF4 family)
MADKRRILLVVLWVVTVLEALMMAGAGSAKFVRPDLWQGMFADWGYPAWGATVVGGAEMLLAVFLLVPRLAVAAAGALAVVMVGALVTVVVHQSELGWQAPVMHLVLLGAIMLLRRRLVAMPSRSS